MTNPIALSAEWLAPGSVDTVSAAVEASLAQKGGRVQGLDADFGSALKMRLIGSAFSGSGDSLPFHLHVDVRPGTAPAETLVRAEMRSTEGFYVFTFAFVDTQYRERFDAVTADLRAATGEVST
jgi:hypothetical protein